MKSFWDNLPKPFLVLAPMEGVTDKVFRAVVAKAGAPDVFYTEFTNVSSFASEKGRANALERLERNEWEGLSAPVAGSKNDENADLSAGGTRNGFSLQTNISQNEKPLRGTGPADKQVPIVAQIWGRDPAQFGLLASELAGLGFDGLDLNFGCPDKNVVKTGGGSGMILTPDLAVECIRQAKNATSLPVSVKTRLGYSRPDEFRTWLPTLLKENLAVLTVHLRTKKEMSKVPAHYELIPEILKLRAELAPQTKLVINGDIRDRAHALELHEQYPEIDGFMIGRGVFKDVFCFKSNKTADVISIPDSAEPGKASSSAITPVATVRQSEQKREFTRSFSSEEQLSHETGVIDACPETNCSAVSLFLYHLDLFDARRAELEAKGQKYPFEPLKHFYKVYFNGAPNSANLRERLMTCSTTAELRDTIAQELAQD